MDPYLTQKTFTIRSSLNQWCRNVADWYEEHKNDLNDDIWAYLPQAGLIRNGTSSNTGCTILAGTKPSLPSQTCTSSATRSRKSLNTRLESRGIDYKYCVLKNGDYWYFGEDWVDKKIKTQSFTRKELEEAGFGWVFDCPGVEVKEVE